MPDTGGSRVRVTKDGPYLLDGPLALSKQTIVVDDKHESVAFEESDRREQGSCALCRCGGSGIKPYCDGTHRVIGFDGTETATGAPYEDAADAIEGPGLVLLDEVDLCAQARFCSAKGKIWRRIADDDDESREVVIEQSNLCPSGRYTAVDRDTAFAHEPDLEPSIGLIEDPHAGVSGPVWVRGGVPVISADGQPYEVRNRVTLCRCGGSKNKPFCDSTHVDIGFDDSE
jgi:CDGSH-type Zn-finger protein